MSLAARLGRQRLAAALARPPVTDTHEVFAPPPAPEPEPELAAAVDDTPEAFEVDTVDAPAPVVSKPWPLVRQRELRCKSCQRPFQATVRPGRPPARCPACAARRLAPPRPEPKPTVGRAEFDRIVSASAAEGLLDECDVVALRVSPPALQQQQRHRTFVGRCKALDPSTGRECQLLETHGGAHNAGRGPFAFALQPGQRPHNEDRLVVAALTRISVETP